MAEVKNLDKGYLKVEELGFIAHEYVTADEQKEAELAAATAFSFMVETGVNESGEPVREAIGVGGLEMEVGDAAKVIAVVAPFISKCPKVVWESSNPEVAAVNDLTYELADEALIEVIHALKAGEATITISSIPEKKEDAVISASFGVVVGGAEEEETVTDDPEEEEPEVPTVADPEQEG